MKVFLWSFIAALYATIGPLLFAADSAQILAELKRIEVLNHALENGGLAEMLAVSRPCLLIHSQYYADKIAIRNPELRELERAKRDFGLKLARALDQEAVQLQASANTEERVKQATLLLDIAGWIKTCQGYGNYILFSRCESLTVVPLAYLTADLKYPLKKIAVLRERITPSAEERAFRVAVLNNEAPAPFINQLRENDSDQDDQIAIAWNTKWHALALWLKEKNISISDAQRDILPDDLAFFLDDEHAPKPFTTTNLWNLKRHETLVYGHRDVMVKDIDQFMLYREKVGFFPTQPPKWWTSHNEGETALETAFEDACRDLHRDNGQPFGSDVPAMLYQQVSDGNVLDRDTQYSRSFEAQKRTPSGKP